ncbi:MAG: hypothetical protein WC061_00235 [Melioribacteraceae bacterium]
MIKKLLFLLIFTSIISGKPAEPGPVDQRIIQYTFNEQYDLAKKLCQDQININQTSPKYYYYLINTKIFEYYQKVAELDPSKRDEGRKTLNKEIINYCENIIDKIDDSNFSVENKFYYGTIYAYLARIYGVDASWWSAFKSGKKAKNYMQEVLKADPKFYDAYLVLGMLEYYADRMSGVTGFIAGVLGLSGSRETGLNYLKLAYDNGKLTFGQTSLTMIEVYSSLEGNEYAALPFFEKFLDRFPKNKRTLNAYCQTLMNLWEVKKAGEIIRSDKDNLIDDYAKARFYDITGNPALAIQHGEKALLNEKTLYRGGANASRYFIVINSWLNGDNARVKKYEPTLSDRFKDELLSARKNEKEFRWLRELSIDIAFDKSAADVEQFLKSKPDFTRLKSFEDEYNLLIGVFYFRNNHFDKAEQYFDRAVNSTGERERYSAVRYLIEIYLKQTVGKAKVENLLLIIDNLANARLSSRSRDLVKKYNL